MPSPIATPSRCVTGAAARAAAASCAQTTGLYTTDARTKARITVTIALPYEPATLVIPLSFLSRLVVCKPISMVDVNGHADEHGRQQRKYISLDQHDDDLERRDAHRKRNRDHEADADARHRIPEHL